MTLSVKYMNIWNVLKQSSMEITGFFCDRDPSISIQSPEKHTNTVFIKDTHTHNMVNQPNATE